MPQLNSKKRVIIMVLLVSFIAAFLLVTAYVIFLKTTAGDNTKEISPVPSETAETPGQERNLPGIPRVTKGSKPRTKGGAVGFKPAGGSFSHNITVQLSVGSPLESMKGYTIDSDIYYTLDSTEPSKDTGKKYSPETLVPLTGTGEITIKARLISKLGHDYKGDVYSQTYTLQPVEVQSSSPTVSSSTTPPVKRDIGTQNTLTDFNSLEKSTREEIIKYTKRIVIAVEGITRINQTGNLKFRLSISKEGEAKMLGISGFTVDPPGKLAQIESQLDQKIRGIPFTVPTSDGSPIDVETWVGFNKIAKYFDKVIIER